jgi:hypothetical protein
LAGELVRSPEIVIVNESKPLAARLGGSAIPRGAHSAGRLVTDDPNSGIAKRGDDFGRVIGRRLVDDDDLELDVLLA